MHVVSDIPTNGYHISSENIQTQNFMKRISEWTIAKDMVLTTKKSKVMILNFCNDCQISSRFKIDEQTIKTIQETKLLAIMVNNKLN